MKRQKVRKTILLISLLIFPITLNYFSPYLIIQGGFKGVVSGSAMMFAAQFITALIFGRAFCGWLCPAGALQEATAGINEKPAGKKLKYIKYFIWVPWLAAIIGGFIAAGGAKQIDVLYFTENGISVYAPPMYIVYFAVITIMAVLSLALGKRAACQSICWMAPFMVLGSLLKEKLCIPSLRLTADPKRCTACKACEKHCPMGLPVSDMAKSGKTFHSECVLCGACADRCAQGALKLRFCAAKPPARTGSVRAEKEMPR
jgi:polyferredoxin